MPNPNMTNREVCDLIFVDYLSKKPFLNLDFANVTTTELTGETVYAYGGKGHPKRVQFGGERGGTLTIETQIQTMKLWQLMTGGEITNTAKFIQREEVTAGEDGKITLSVEPATNDVTVYKADDDLGVALPLAASNPVSGTNVTLETAVTSGAKLIVYYIKAVTEKVQKISINATTFPKSFVVYGDTVMRTEADELLPYKLVAYKVTPQSNMSLSFSNNGDPASITITCDLMADGDNNVLDLILIEE